MVGDIRQAFRMLRKDPGFTAVALIALMLGIAANTAIFSVVDKVLLQPLPYPEADRLMSLGEQQPDGVQDATSIPKYVAWRNNDVFAAIAVYDQGGPGLNLSSGDRPVQIKGLHVSAEFFKVFGVSPVSGRSFTVAEDSPNGPKAAVVGESLWRSHFSADPSIIGKTIVLNSDAYTVVGIMPGSFVANPPAEIWLPIQIDPASTNQGDYLAVAARLKPGVTLAQARAEMRLIGERFRRANSKFMGKNESVPVVPMRQAVVEDVRTALLVLAAAVLFVLLIACGNVANLLLARSTSRQRELAIRAAIGASRRRIIRQLLTESIVLAFLGGAAGLLLGVCGVRTLLLLLPHELPRLPGPSQTPHLLALIDWRIALFTLVVSVLTGLVFGLFPAVHVSTPDVSSMLKESASRSGTGRRQNRVRKALVASEIALALVLLTGAALLIQTFQRLSTSNPGIDPNHVVTFLTSLSGSKYFNTANVNNFATQVIRRIEALPGVSSASLSLGVPTETDISLPFEAFGRLSMTGQARNGDGQYRFVTPGYFSVLRIPLLRGRLFAIADAANSPKVVLINRSMAQKYWPNENPLGRLISIAPDLGTEFKDAPRQIVGIVGDVSETGLDDKNLCVMYIPQSQVPDGITQLISKSIPVVWAVRTSMDLASARNAIVHELQSVDGQMALSDFRPMKQILSKSVGRQQFNMLLLSLFATIALLLAAIGIYGVMSYFVEQQTQELGIRMALGADKRDILRLVVGQGMTPAFFGVVAGVTIAFGVTRLLASLLYGIKPDDPLTFVSVALVLLAVALFAAYVPALRAMKIDPIVALRREA